jgi:hypothetical protein
MSEDTVEEFDENVPMKRPWQPAELATAYVMLADPLSSYMSGATIAVTGGKPILYLFPNRPLLPRALLARGARPSAKLNFARTG